MAKIFVREKCNTLFKRLSMEISSKTIRFLLIFAGIFSLLSIVLALFQTRFPLTATEGEIESYKDGILMVRSQGAHHEFLVTEKSKVFFHSFLQGKDPTSVAGQEVPARLFETFFRPGEKARIFAWLQGDIRVIKTVLLLKEYRPLTQEQEEKREKTAPRYLPPLLHSDN